MICPAAEGCLSRSLVARRHGSRGSAQALPRPAFATAPARQPEALSGIDGNGNQGLRGAARCLAVPETAEESRQPAESLLALRHEPP